ncbi:MAG TPA: alpha/beta fold hydrolase [Steroidobacteraceae bacterium]|nr:alpha/beta fold hydrolase [Steroidobacteraceae bacterium]
MNCKLGQLFMLSVLVHLATHAGAAAAPQPQEITIPAGAVTLAARLYLPAGAGPFPALVFTHGSGASGRDSGRYQEEARFFVNAGIACLIYDKRGYGQSTGNWQTASFDDLAADASAAARYLKTRPAIARDRIGLRGASQSGWILPIAAARSADIAFLVMISPPGVTPYEQVLYDVRTDLEDAGFASNEVARALRITRSGLDYARTGRGWAEHQKQIDAAAGERWLEIAAGPPSSDDWLWKWIHPLIDFDVLPVVKQLHVPVLVLLGEQDREVPSQTAGHLLQAALADNPQAAIRYFPDGDHDLRSTTAPKVDGRAPFAAGYLESISAWVLEH